jgi:hypothetical protein
VIRPVTLPILPLRVVFDVEYLVLEQLELIRNLTAYTLHMLVVRADRLFVNYLFASFRLVLIFERYVLLPLHRNVRLHVSVSVSALLLLD